MENKHIDEYQKQNGKRQEVTLQGGNQSLFPRLMNNEKTPGKIVVYS